MTAYKDTTEEPRPGPHPPRTPPSAYPPYDPNVHPPHLRPRPPLPRAPGWLPFAVLAVGVVAAPLATLNRPGIGLVITGVVAGLTALAALTARPAATEGGPEETEASEGPDGAAEPREEHGQDSSRRAPGPDAAADAGGAPEKGRADGPRTGSEPAHHDGPEERAPIGSPDRTDPESGGPRTAGAPDTADEDGPANPPHHPQTHGSGREHTPWPQHPGQPPHGAVAPAPRPVLVPAADPEPERHRRAWSAVFGALAAVLLATAALRDAGWVLVWTLTGAFLLASLAFALHNPAARRGPVGVVAGSLALLRHLPASPRFLLGPPRSGRGRGLVGPAVLTAAVTAVLLTVFGVLFSFADPVFASYLARPFEDVNLATVVSGLFGAALAVLFTGSAVLAARRRPKPRYVPLAPVEATTASSGRRWPAWVWSVPLGSLIALFTAFVVVQGAVMFGGDDYVQSVTGLVYAEYARQGFFQLVVVSFLVLGVIALVTAVVPAREAAARTVRNALLGLLCLLTLVILVSAMMRLQLYIDAFGLTRMRVGAEAWILWSGAVFVLVMVAGLANALGRSTAWLPRAAVALSAVALAVFAYGNPDLRIAESHRDLDLAAVDTEYLRDLSADAVPGLMELAGDDRDCALLGLRDRLEAPEGRGFASWNLSRRQGRQQLAELGMFNSVDLLEADCAADARY